MEASHGKYQFYAQEDEFIFVQKISKFIYKTFVDIGAEQGAFSQVCIDAGMSGVAFEPLPKHYDALEMYFQDKPLDIYPWAIDSEDRKALFHIATDEDGNTLDYYHSLQKIENDSRIRHNKTLEVTCRSIASLDKEKLLPELIGILKIDTEGNDLRVLRGIGEIRPLIIICEFFTEGIYAGWSDAHPRKLIDCLKPIGYSHFIAFIHNKNNEKLNKIDSLHFAPEEWGNIVFIHDSIYNKVQPVVSEYDSVDYTPLVGYSLESFLLEQLNKQNENGILVDVGAFRGDFSLLISKHNSIMKSILFEPNPVNLGQLHALFSDSDNFDIIPHAVSSHSASESIFNINDDPTTGSLLPYIKSTSPVATFNVNTITLDEWYHKHSLGEKISLIKIDTQGSDLEVLKGAEGLLSSQHPMLVVELIWIKLYMHQAHPVDIFTYLHSNGYSLAGFFNEHLTSDNRLAFSDAVFIHDGGASPLPDFDFHIKPDAASLLESNAELAKTCKERLELIERIHREAAILRNELEKSK